MPTLSKRPFAVLAVLTCGFFMLCQTVSHSDDLDPLSWLQRGSLPGALYGDAVTGIGIAMARATQVRKEAYERQMKIDFAQTALGKCGDCSNRDALKAKVDELIAADEKLHRAVEAIAGHSGIGAALHILMDPTGQRDRRYRRQLNFENRVADFCYVESKKDVDADRSCINSYSMEFLEKQASTAWGFCRDAVLKAYGVTRPEDYPFQPHATDPPDEARDFFISCKENSTIALLMMRKVAEICAMSYENIKNNPPDPYDLMKKCNSDPDGPLGTPDEILASALRIRKSPDPGSAERAFALFSHMAGKHHPPAMFYTGQALLTGSGVGKNEAAALEMFQQSSSRGNENSMVSLALMYKNGTAVSQDLKTAIRYLEYVSRQRTQGPAADASLVLARMYAAGDGVAPSVETAASYYLESALRQSYRRDQKDEVTTQIEHPEYIQEASIWLVNHKYFDQIVGILQNADYPSFRLEAAKWYLTGWTNVQGQTTPPKPAAAAWVLKTYLLNGRVPDADVVRQAQTLYDAIPASAKK
jgi:hypothetical protein